MTTTNTNYRRMWNRAVGVYGGRKPANWNAQELTEETGVLHHVRAMTEEWRGGIYTNYGIFADMDEVPTEATVPSSLYQVEDAR